MHHIIISSKNDVNMTKKRTPRLCGGSFRPSNLLRCCPWNVRLRQYRVLRDRFYCRSLWLLQRCAIHALCVETCHGNRPEISRCRRYAVRPLIFHQCRFSKRPEISSGRANDGKITAVNENLLQGRNICAPRTHSHASCKSGS